jgi:hypothetical protein
MPDGKFIGICIIITGIIVAVAIVLKPAPNPEFGRYQFQASSPPGVVWRMDTATGKIETNP